MIQFQYICFGLFLIIVSFSQGCNGGCSITVRPPCHWENDATLNESANGSAVVEAVLEKLNCLKVFSWDYILMERIALVESEYGERNDACAGGIWRLERETFDMLFNYQDVLQNISDVICSRSGVSFFDHIKYEFLQTKPFYSGLAARLYLHYLEITGVSVPFKGSVVEQAEFWIQNYHRVNGIAEAAAKENFINKTGQQDFKCTINADILFLLDTSTSAEEHQFQRMQKFLLKFVENLKTIGPQDNQVGVIRFANSAQVLFPLDQYNTSTDLLSAIDALANSLPYHGGNTNLAEGLCRLREGFRKENGARSMSDEVFRVAIIITDGKPTTRNRRGPHCRVNDTTYIQEAEILRNPKYKIGTYVIGVTENINDSVLRAIATEPTDEYVTHIDNFNRLPDQEEYIYEICKRASIGTRIDRSMNGLLDKDEIVRYHYLIPDIGITAEVCVSEGHVKVYGSVTIPNPNSALYSWKLEVRQESQETGTQTCQSYFLEITSTTTTSAPTNTSGATSQDTDPTIDDYEALTLTDQTLYISVEGLEDHNIFIVNGTSGNTQDVPTTTSPTTPHPKVSVIVTATISGLVLIVICIFVLYLVHCLVRRHKKKKMEKEDDKQDLLLSEDVDYLCSCPPCLKLSNDEA